MKLDPGQLLRFNLSQPTVSQVVGIRDLEQLKYATAVARGFTAMPEEDQTALMDSVREEAGDGRYETFKINQRARRPAPPKTTRLRPRIAGSASLRSPRRFSANPHVCNILWGKLQLNAA